MFAWRSGSIVLVPARLGGAEGDRTPDLMSAIQMAVPDPTFAVSVVFRHSGYRKVSGVMSHLRGALGRFATGIDAIAS